MRKIIKLIFLVSIVFSGCTTGKGISPSPESLSTSEITPTEILLGSCSTLDNTGRIVEKGKIVFYDPDKGLYFYDALSGEEQLIPNTIDTLTPAVSPDRKRIAYFDFRSQTGYVISADRNRIEPHIKGKFDGYFYGWLDNHKVIFVDRSRTDGSIITLEVDTGNISQTITGLQDLYSLDPNRWYAGGDWPSVIFDSTLSRMIYLSGELHGEAKGKLGFIMREMGTRKLLWSKVSSDVGVQPKWSPDDALAAVVITKDDETGDQIYIIDREGREVQVINTDTTGINVVEWSPNGKRLSFGNDGVLAIYNFTSTQLHEYRLPEEIWNIVWSPSGNQIAVKNFLVDLSSGCAMPLKSGNAWGPLAWLADMP